MKHLRWQDLGFSEKDSRALARLQRHLDSFSLESELALWAQWVSEVEWGFDWTEEELDAAWSAQMRSI